MGEVLLLYPVVESDRLLANLLKRYQYRKFWR